MRLEKCKHCGGDPVLVKVGDWKQFYVYFCSHCWDTPVYLHEARITPWGAARIWNKRTREIK